MMESNLFNISEPKLQICSLFFYSVSLSTLVISLNQEGAITNETLYLVLEGVEYIEAPKFWKGANFYEKDKKALIEFCKVIGLYTRWLTMSQSHEPTYYEAEILFEKLIEYYRFFVAQPVNGSEIRIIAKKGYITNHLTGIVPEV